MLEQYSETRHFLMEALENIEKVSQQENYSRIQQEAKRISSKLRSNAFNLAVLGQFKRGKTTLINALLGCPLLPTAMVPLTSVITQITYGPAPQATVFFKDGRSLVIPVEQLDEYVTENKNPNNHKEVDYVEVKFNSPYLQNGVQLIDTPGVGSVFRHNTDVAYEYVPSADAVIFVFSVDPPLSEAEVNFLANIKEWVNKIFFIQNKVDFYEPEEIEESLAFSTRLISSILGTEKPVRVFPISAKQALEGKLENDPQQLARSGLPEFEEVLSSFLVKEKGRTFLVTSAKNLLRLIEQIVMSIELEEKSLETPIEKMQEKIQAFNTEVEKIKQDKNDNLYLLRGEFEQLINTLDNDLEEFRKLQTGLIAAKIQQFYQDNKNLKPRQFNDRIEEFLKKAIQDAFDVWRVEEEKKITQRYNAILQRFNGKANEIINRINQLSADIFNIPLSQWGDLEVLEQEDSFSYKIGRDPLFLEITPVTFSFLLPRQAVNWFTYRQVYDRVEMEVDRTCGRIRFDFLERVKNSLQRFQAQLEEKMEDTLEVIHDAIKIAAEKKKGSEEEKIKRLVELQKIKATLSAQSQKLREVISVY